MTLPAPLTPPDCDLQDFHFMPLQVARLRDSDFAAYGKPEACWYGVLLWSASWHQLPAGSLPDDDVVLTKLCGLGRDTKSFGKAREGAMRGWVKCSDGRLYHPVVAEQALAAWESKLHQRHRTECARIKKVNQRQNTEHPVPTFEEFTSSSYCPPDKPGPGPDGVPGDSPKSPEGHGIQETGIGTGTGILEEEPNGSVLAAAPPKTPAARKTRRRVVYPADFETCWQAYPHVQGRSAKERSLAEYQALPEEEREALPGAISRFKPKVAEVHGGKGAPDMSRWLRDGKHLHWMPSNDTGGVPIERWRNFVALWKSGEAWPDDRLGPAPDQPGTKVPPQAMEAAA